jgi:hypothetical protein
MIDFHELQERARQNLRRGQLNPKELLDVFFLERCRLAIGRTKSGRTMHVVNKPRMRLKWGEGKVFIPGCTPLCERKINIYKVYSRADSHERIRTALDNWEKTFRGKRWPGWKVCLKCLAKLPYVIISTELE